MLIYILGVMGSGKTLCATIYAKYFSKSKPKSMIYANYQLNLPNFTYSPFMFLPLSKLNDCLIICDDFYALNNVKTFTGVVANLSRKKDITIILTAQYYTMIPPQLRELANYEIQCIYQKEIDVLWTQSFKPNNEFNYKKVRKAVKRVKKLYDTKEVVHFPTDNEIKSEILRFSKNLHDLEFNLMLFSNNRGTRERFFKELKVNFE